MTIDREKFRVFFIYNLELYSTNRIDYTIKKFSFRNDLLL